MIDSITACNVDSVFSLDFGRWDFASPCTGWLIAASVKSSMLRLLFDSFFLSLVEVSCGVDGLDSGEGESPSFIIFNDQA